MIKQAFLPLSFLLFLLTACGDNIRPESDSFGDDDGACIDEYCPSDVDQPDAGTTMPDGGGTDADTCGTCPEGQVCVDGACVCDQDGDPSLEICAPDEVQLCHVPNGNPDASHGICVGSSAVQAHEAHGDTLGACP